VPDRWLTQHIRPTKRLGKRTLVLCRSRATVSLVRRWVVRRGGMHGLDVGTPAGLAAQLARAPLLGPDAAVGEPDTGAELPAGTEAATLLAGRPGLAAVARRWVRLHRLNTLAGAATDAPAWLTELARAGWGRDTDDHALCWLLQTAAAGKPLLDGGSWDRVVALGFDAPDGVVAPWERALVGHLGASVPTASSPALSGAWPALRVPDVSAEARVAVAWIAMDPEDSVVLTATDATARRVRDTLHRSGLPCAWRDRLPLRTHTLAGVVVAAARWFNGKPDPWVQVGDLAAVLSQTVLGRALHPAAEALLDERLAAIGASRTDARLSKRGAVTVLGSTRLLEAPLSRWIARLQELSVPGEDHPAALRRAARAAAIEVRLRLLHAAVTAQDPGQALASVAPDLSFDLDDFESIMAELLGETAGADAPGAGTLGALKAFLVHLRVRVHADPVARAILAALASRAAWSATSAHVHHALGGAVDPGRLTEGISVVAVDEWDGRPARRVVLLDVHDRGLARRPAPDALLTDAEIAALGGAASPIRVAHRLDQARRALAGAEASLVLVTRRDADGRDVTPPVRLDLTLQDAAVDSYGLGLEGLPETAQITGLIRGAETAPVAPSHPDRTLSRMSVQATAEWVRAGRGARSGHTAESLPPAPTLADLLQHDGEAAPPWVARYLGHTGDDPIAALPEGPHSATGLLRAASHCLYQAYGTHVLGLRPHPELAMDLDPAEIGRAVHDAIQHATAPLLWRGDTEAARADELGEELRVQTRATFSQATAALGALSAARETSAQGRLDRWNAHWPAFAASRLARPESLEDPWKLYHQIKKHPAVLVALHTARSVIPAAREVDDWIMVQWLISIAKVAVEPFLALAPAIQLIGLRRVPLPETLLPDLPDFIRHPDTAELRRVVRNMQWRAAATSQPLSAVLAELPFGNDEAEPALLVLRDGESVEVRVGPISLPLGRADVRLVGRIDRVAVLPTQHGPLLEVTDYKTGRPPAVWAFQRDVIDLVDPQLLVYAAVLQHAGDALPEPLRGARVAIVAWDHVRHTYARPTRRDALEVPDTRLLVDTSLLDRARHALGALLDRARDGQWTLRPRGDTCPQLQQFGHDYCPFVGACRLRALPAEAS